MKASKILVYLALLLTIPAAASAQIVIERLNQDVDPSAPVVVEPDEESGGTNGASSDGTDDEAEDTKLDEDDLAQIKDVLVEQITATHSRCMKGKIVKRPGAGSPSGTGTWAINKKGKATFKKGASLGAAEMYFISAQVFKESSETTRQYTFEKASKEFDACTKGKNTQVPVEGKSGLVTIAYKVGWKGGAAVIDVTNIAAAD